MPTASIRYPQGTFGYPPGSPTGGGSVVETFVATGLIAAGACVELDPAVVGGVKLCQANTVKFVGIAEHGATAGEVVQVTMMGPAVANTGSPPITAGAALQVTVAGNVATQSTPAFGAMVGLAVESTTGAGPIRILVAKM